MKTLIAALMAAFILVAGAAPAQACYQGGKHYSVSEKRAKFIAKRTHEVWPKPTWAHRWQKRIACESGFRTHVRNGQYVGLLQMGEDERAYTNWNSTILGQLRAGKRWHQAGGTWACPL